MLSEDEKQESNSEGVWENGRLGSIPAAAGTRLGVMGHIRLALEVEDSHRGIAQLVRALR